MAHEKEALVKLATEYWRLLRSMERILNESIVERVESFTAQVRYSSNKLHTICAESGLRLIAYDREPYSANLPVTIANADAASAFDNPVIERTIEPTIISDGQVLAMGKVHLRNRM